MAIDIVARALAVSGKQNLENYYTKTESDGRYVKQLGELNKVYSTDSVGKDGSIGYSQLPANSAITQYSSSGTVRTNNPTENIDAVNKQYANRYYETLNYFSATAIPANADMDKYVTFGNYYANNVQGVTNLPSGIESKGNTLKLIISMASSDIAAYQTLYVWSSDDGEFKGKYTRSTVGEGWKPWEKFATTNDIDNKKVFSVTIYEAGD